jgi:hypothetical protein
VISGAGFVDFVLLWIWSSSPFWFVSLSEIDSFNDSFALPVFKCRLRCKNGIAAIGDDMQNFASCCPQYLN